MPDSGTEHLYEVLSGDVYFEPSMEPPVEDPCYVEVRATSRDEAIRQALRHHDMRPWVTQQRGDGRNPLWGVRARRRHCVHGVCLCNDNLDRGVRNSCPVCRDFDETVDRLRDACMEARPQDWERDSRIVKWANTYDERHWNPAARDIPESLTTSQPTAEVV